MDLIRNIQIRTSDFQLKKRIETAIRYILGKCDLFLPPILPLLPFLVFCLDDLGVFLSSANF